MNTREIAQNIAKDEVLLSHERRYLADAVNSALQQAIADERERCARIAETHYSEAVECPGGAECSLRIATAIRHSETQEGR